MHRDRLPCSAIGPTAVTVNLRRIVFWSTVGLLVLYVVQFPEHAGRLVHLAGGGLAHLGASLVDFVGSVV